MPQWKVTQQESGTKLIVFLRDKLGPDYSARSLKRSVESNHCLINGRVERFGSAMLGNGDLVDYQIEDQAAKATHRPFFSPDTLFLDSHLLIINKPAGISSDDGTLLKHLEAKHGSLLLVHRLDKETTGALIFARRPEVFKSMVLLFRQQTVKKKYLTIVDGFPDSPQGKISNYIGKIHDHQGQSLWGQTTKDKGLPAKTEWHLASRGLDSALLICTPVTGRTHQLRVHLSELGHPILGDKKYGKHFRCLYLPQRCLLHAFELAFPHPVQPSIVKVKAPIPEDFLVALKALEIPLGGQA